jgi:hypothetical protein
VASARLLPAAEDSDNGKPTAAGAAAKAAKTTAAEEPVAGA